MMNKKQFRTIVKPNKYENKILKTKKREREYVIVLLK